MTPTDDTRALKTADWHLRRAIGNALGLEPHPVYEWAWLDADDNIHQYAPYETDLATAWRLQQEHPIPGTICLNLSWLQLPPEQAAYEMAQAWLKWATAAAPAADGEEA